MCWNVEKEWEKYTGWLAERVGLRGFRRGRRSYRKLFETLQSVPFLVLIRMDKNRLEDGLYLRMRYRLANEIPEFLFDEEPCSVLEMLVALAIRADLEWIGEPGEPDPAPFFWEMIENLELDLCSDGRYNRVFVVKKCQKWLNREFKNDGNGSIFPIKMPFRDQREIEIWCQMMEYFHENY